MRPLRKSLGTDMTAEVCSAINEIMKEEFPEYSYSLQRSFYYGGGTIEMWIDSSQELMSELSKRFFHLKHGYTGEYGNYVFVNDPEDMSPRVKHILIRH